MDRRSRFLTFITALVPGLGQMYLGLIKKGIQIFVLFILIRPVLSIIGLGYLGDILKIIIWVFAFFDTFDIARRIDKGETVGDTDFVFQKYMNDKHDEFTKPSFQGFKFNRNMWMVCGWGLIAVGILAIMNLMFNTNDLYGLIKSYISSYFIPVLLVAGGCYLLFRNKR